MEGISAMNDIPNNTALRYDNGKPRYDLIPPEAIEALAILYTQGSKKYSERNWEEGMNWCRCFSSMMRHSWKWLRGEDYDYDEKTNTKTHHMISVAWNAFALYTYCVRFIGKDDRPKRYE
jgi:hypothetical protein